MHQIQPLDWDTNFFGYKVGKLSLSMSESVDVSKIELADFDLVYLFAEQSIEEDLLNKWGAELQDIKVELIKELKLEAGTFNKSSEIQIKTINIFSDALMKLVLESGVCSRFKLDKKFNKNEFERLYKAWIKKALVDNEAIVMGAFNNDELLGFISLGINALMDEIGLFAVSENVRGKQIGKSLLHAAQSYSTQRQCQYLKVVTQENNILAMHFYKNNGFEIHKKTYIYHLWKTIS
jgi:dTDP-4-amino-4,6-dideoxy-D-galactose acyltransferase